MKIKNIISSVTTTCFGIILMFSYFSKPSLSLETAKYTTVNQDSDLIGNEIYGREGRRKPVTGGANGPRR